MEIFLTNSSLSMLFLDVHAAENAVNSYKRERVGATGVMPGFSDTTRFGLPADYLLPKLTPQSWNRMKNDMRIPLYQGSNIFMNGGFKGLRGRSLSRYLAANPVNDPKATLFNPLNHPEWFYPNYLDPIVAPYFIPNRFEIFVISSCHPY